MYCKSKITWKSANLLSKQHKNEVNICGPGYAFDKWKGRGILWHFLSIQKMLKCSILKSNIVKTLSCINYPSDKFYDMFCKQSLFLTSRLSMETGVFKIIMPVVKYFFFQKSSQKRIWWLTQSSKVSLKIHYHVKIGRL